jgi:hypothetical protein
VKAVLVERTGDHATVRLTPCALKAARARAHELIYARTDGGPVIIDFMIP